jgi:hypothetical protein
MGDVTKVLLGAGGIISLYVAMLCWVTILPTIGLLWSIGWLK